MNPDRAMQRTASKRVVYILGVCDRVFGFMAPREGSPPLISRLVTPMRVAIPRRADLSR